MTRDLLSSSRAASLQKGRQTIISRGPASRRITGGPTPHQSHKPEEKHLYRHGQIVRELQGARAGEQVIGHVKISQEFPVHGQIEIPREQTPWSSLNLSHRRIFQDRRLG
jgi:hypothetical protein